MPRGGARPVEVELHGGPLDGQHRFWTLSELTWLVRRPGDKAEARVLVKADLFDHGEVHRYVVERFSLYPEGGAAVAVYDSVL